MHHQYRVTASLLPSTLLTIQLVLEWPARFPQLRAVDLLSRKHSIQHQAEQIVARHPAAGFPAGKAPDAIFRPWNLAFQLCQRERARLKQSWRGTAGDAIAGEIKEIEQRGEAENNGSSAQSERRVRRASTR